MRKKVFSFILAIAALSVGSCVTEPAPYINANADIDTFPAEGGKMTVAIDCNRENWSAVVEDSKWARIQAVNRNSGIGSVVVFCTVNDDETERANALLLSCEGASTRVEFTQAKCIPDPITAVIVPGLYGLNGLNYFASIDGSSQVSLLQEKNGLLAIRILYPLTNSVSEVSGIPAKIAKGDKVNLDVKIVSNLDVILEEGRQFSAVRVKDGMVWLKDVSDANVYIVAVMEEEKL